MGVAAAENNILTILKQRESKKNEDAWKERIRLRK
jgi:hypothetical protein